MRDNEQILRSRRMEVFEAAVTNRIRYRRRMKQKELTCERCGQIFEGISARYCPDCRCKRRSDKAKKCGFGEKGTEALAKYKAEKEGKKNENA